MHILFSFPSVSVQAVGEIEGQEAADHHSSGLKRDTGYHDLVAHVHHLLVCRVGRRLNATSDTLCQETDCIAGNKQPCVELRRQTRVLGAVVRNEMLHCEVETGRQERWRDDEEQDLNDERTSLPWVGMHQYASNIPNRLAQTSKTDDDGIGTEAVFDAKNNLRDSTDAKEDYHDDVDAEIWVVAISRGFDRALWRDARTVCGG